MIRFGLNVGYSGAQLAIDMDLVREAERLGFHSVWTAEAYGSDAVTPLAWIGGQTRTIRLGSAIMQMSARTPAMTASTATSLDQLSGGRFLLGLGVSGPQVVEGWHGQPFGKPLTRTREYIEIVRAIWARERPLEHQGEHYQIPYRGPGATGLGKPLRSILHGRQIPIYVAATRPKSVAQAAEIADGWLAVWYSPYRTGFYRDALESGFRRAGGGKSLASFDVAPAVTVIQGDNELACRYGFEVAAKKVQDLYLDGKKAEATAAVPNELADEVSLVGPPARIRDRLAAWRESGVKTLICGTRQAEAMRTLVEAGG